MNWIINHIFSFCDVVFGWFAAAVWKILNVFYYSQGYFRIGMVSSSWVWKEKQWDIKQVMQKKFLIYLRSIVLWWVKQATISVDIKNIQWVFLLLFDIYFKIFKFIMNSWQTYWFLIKMVYDNKIIKKKRIICQYWRLNAQLEAHLYSMRDRFILCSLSNIRWQRRLIVIQIIELQG